MEIKISAIAYSVSITPRTIDHWVDRLINQIRQEIEGGSQIVIYPELFTAELSVYFEGGLNEQLHEVAQFIRDELLPQINTLLSSYDNSDELLLCLGSGPWLKEDELMNSSPVWINGQWFFQDKLHLTPWEVDFEPGDEVLIFDYFGLKCAVVICYDSEQPGLALFLKEEGVELIMLPYATTNKNGGRRVNRCASARSVELGAAVIAVPLIGDAKCPLIDHHEGSIGFYLPAQEDAPSMMQEISSEYSLKETLIEHFILDSDMLKRLKTLDLETKPFLKKDHPNLKLKRVNQAQEEIIYQGVEGH